MEGVKKKVREEKKKTTAETVMARASSLKEEDAPPLVAVPESRGYAIFLGFRFGCHTPTHSDEEEDMKFCIVMNLLSVKTRIRESARFGGAYYNLNRVGGPK